MSTLQSVGAFVFLMAYYYFVLRKYNGLGLRLFSIFTFVALFVTYLWWQSDLDLKRTEREGIRTEAVVVKKTAADLTVRLVDQGGQTIERTQKGGISVDEMAAVTEGHPAPVIYRPDSNSLYLASSFERQRHDNVYILYFPAFLFAIGTACLIFLRKYRVLPHEGTLYEYVTNEEGKVVLDDAKNNTTKALRVGSTLSKFTQIFRR
jgi:hypothetical protein